MPGENIQACCCDGGIYIFLVVDVGIGGTPKVVARSRTSGAIVWEFSDSALDFANGTQVSDNTSWCVTENGVCVFAAEGTKNIWLIDFDGVEVRSGNIAYASASKPGKANVAVDGNRLYIFGTDPGNANDLTLAEFNFTTFAFVAEAAHNLITGYTPTANDRILVSAEQIISGSIKTLYVSGNRSLQKFNTNLAHVSEFTPLPSATGGSVGAPALLPAQGLDDGVGNSTRFGGGSEGAIHWDGVATNQRVGGADLTKWPCANNQAESDYFVQNATDERIERYDVTNTFVDAFDWSSIPGFAAGDSCRWLNQDSDGHLYFWFVDFSFAGNTFFFTRLNKDFSTIDFKVLDTRILLSGILFSNTWRAVTDEKGAGISALSEETW